MTSTTSALGRCPDCETTLPPSQVVLEYEPSTGGIEVFAECPACDRVIQTQ